jgi:hypothetical protein
MDVVIAIMSTDRINLRVFWRISMRTGVTETKE